MPNYNKPTFLFSNESEARLTKNQDKISNLESSIGRTERINSGLTKYIPEKENERTLLTSKLDKLKQEFLQEKIKFKQELNFHNFLSVLKILLIIISAVIQRAVWTFIIRFQNYRLERNIRFIQTYRDEVVKIKSDISFIFSQRQAGLELYKGEWLPIEEIQLIREAEIGLADNFASMSDRDFEFFISELLKEMDYDIIKVTPPTGDFGTDIIAKKGGVSVAVQCKKYNEKNRVGNTSIQQLIGSMRYYGASHSIFVTTSDYTEKAKEQTKNASIELWNKDTLHGYVKKYLLKKNVSEIFDAIENAKLKEEEVKQDIKDKIEERKERERNKTICPICGGGKMRNRKMCSRCKNERHRIRKERDYDYGGDLPPYWDMDWDDFNNDFNRRFGGW